jgi:hypothetical protein
VCANSDFSPGRRNKNGEGAALLPRNLAPYQLLRGLAVAALVAKPVELAAFVVGLTAIKAVMRDGLVQFTLLVPELFRAPVVGTNRSSAHQKHYGTQKTDCKEFSFADDVAYHGQPPRQP